MEGRAIAEMRPQAGPQDNFCASLADIAIYGGQAGGGKSFALLMEAARNIDHPKYRGIIFRRTHPEIVTGGGLWDAASELYPLISGIGKEQSRFEFPSGARIQFSHMQHETDKDRHYGAQYAFIAFDELITFTRRQFFFLLTRCRPPHGYDRPCYIRATTNPDADSWVKELIDWWIDDEGYPIYERSEQLRYFTIEDEKIQWVDDDWRGPDGVKPLSITYIPASIDDNPALLERDPNYKRNLHAQDMVTRERLLYGNWKISYAGGMFDGKWFKVITKDKLPLGMKLCRYWDFAASEAVEGSDPDWTSGALCGVHGGNLYILDIERFRETPGTTVQKVQAAAARDGRGVMIAWEEEKGSAGRFNSSHMSGLLSGYEYKPDPVSGDKTERARPLAAAAEFGRVFLLEGSWNAAFLAEAGSFPTKKRDQIDSVDGAYKMLSTTKKVWPEWTVNNVHGFAIDWNNGNELDKCFHYLAIVYAGDNAAVYAAAVYDPTFNMLYVYDCAGWTAASPATVAGEVARRARLKVAGMARLVGNSDMFAAAGGVGAAVLINREFAKQRVPARVTQSMRYDRFGAVAFLGQMFGEGRVLVHKQAADLGLELAAWCVDEASGKPEKGKPYAEALCMIASELREKVVTLKEKKRVDYAPKVKKEESGGGWMSA
jgi:predicted phage terminase large subunit-like protein